MWNKWNRVVFARVYGGTESGTGGTKGTGTGIVLTAEETEYTEQEADFTADFADDADWEWLLCYVHNSSVGPVWAGGIPR
jgi:hypothetical protein